MGRDDQEVFEELSNAVADFYQWSQAYPLDVFPEPDLKKAHELLMAGGMSLDAISAHIMRKTLANIGNVCRDLTAFKKRNEQVASLNNGD